MLTDDFTDNSDVDPIDILQYADNYYDFKFSLEDTLNRPIDLLEDKAIKNPYFIQDILQKRQLVYGY